MRKIDRSAPAEADLKSIVVGPEFSRCASSSSFVVAVGGAFDATSTHAPAFSRLPDLEENSPKLAPPPRAARAAGGAVGLPGSGPIILAVGIDGRLLRVVVMLNLDCPFNTSSVQTYSRHSSPVRPEIGRSSSAFVMRRRP